MDLDVEKSKKILEKKIKEKFPDLGEDKIKKIVNALIEQGQFIQEDDNISVELRGDQEDFNHAPYQEVSIFFKVEMN